MEDEIITPENNPPPVPTIQRYSILAKMPLNIPQNPNDTEPTLTSATS